MNELERCIEECQERIDDVRRELQEEIDELRKYDARTPEVQAAVAWAIEDELDMDYGPGQIGNALDEGRRKPLDIAKWMGAPDGE